MGNTAFQSRGRGFHVSFKNGVVISTQLGYCNYCDNYDGHEDNTEGEDQFEYERKFGSRSSTAEIAIMEFNGDWLTKKYLEQSPRHSDEYHDDVIPRVGMEEWLEIVDWARNYKPPTNKTEE